MVILKIESVKKYPEQAKAMQKEGSVTVQFVVSLSGTVKDIQVIEPSRYDILNKAALQAVRDASPFPKPPGRFFSEDVLLQFKISFETT
jgi:protein TonB